MKTYEQFYINGEWVDPAEGVNSFDVLNPANEEVIGKISMGSSADALDSALSEGQVQGGAGVSNDDATTTGAEVVETADDSGSTEDDSSSLA